MDAALIANLLLYFQEVTDKQVKPGAQKIADEAEPTAEAVNKQIKTGAKYVSENVRPLVPKTCNC